MGKQLLTTISDATGLPDDLVTTELSRLITAAGKEPSEITLDDLRNILADYVQEVLLEAQEDLEGPPGK